jgi:hypothetical protein
MKRGYVTGETRFLPETRFFGKPGIPRKIDSPGRVIMPEKAILL